MESVPSVAIQLPDLNLFADNESCMATFGDEAVCKALSDLQITANGLKSSINQLIAEKETTIQRLQATLSDRPLTTQQQAALQKRIDDLTMEVERLQKIAQGMTKLPPVINSVNNYLSSIRSAIPRKRMRVEEENVEGGESFAEQFMEDVEVNQPRAPKRTRVRQEDLQFEDME